MYGRTVHINETLKEVCNAVNSAEATLREHIKLYYHNANEEFITFLFYGHIKYRLREASHNKSIEKAFLKDLKSSLGHQTIIDWGLDRKLHQENEGDVHKIISWGKCNRVKSSDVINFSDFFSMFHLCSCNIRFFSCPFLVHRIQLSGVYVK